MESRLIDFTLHCWEHYLRPFFVAVLIGILAGALLGDTAHARPSVEAGAPSQPVAAAGRVRQQAQRIAKPYQQIGLKLDAERAGRLVALATKQMEDDLASLARRRWRTGIARTANP